MKILKKVSNLLKFRAKTAAAKSLVQTEKEDQMILNLLNHESVKEKVVERYGFEAANAYMSGVSVRTEFMWDKAGYKIISTKKPLMTVGYQLNGKVNKVELWHEYQVEDK